MCLYAWLLSHVWLFATPWTVAHQASLSMGFSRQEYWNRLPFPTAGNLPNPGIKPQSPVSPVLPSRFFTTASPGKPSYRLNRPIFFPLIHAMRCVSERIYYHTSPRRIIMMTKSKVKEESICSKHLKDAEWIKECVCIWAAAAKSHQSCPALCDPIAGSPPGSPVPGSLSRQEYWSGLPVPSPVFGLLLVKTVFRQ